MLLEGLFKHTKIPLLEKSLDASTVRQRVRANNIANVSTVGYQRLEVSFEEALRQALRSNTVSGAVTNEKHIPLGKQGADRIEPEVFTPDDPVDPSGVNNVDIEYEMAQLAKNQLLYTAAAEFTQRSFSKIKEAIRGRVQ